MTQETIVPVILCGGSGTRLWPASRENHPKQFLSLMNDNSLIQNTMKRALLASGAAASSLVTVTLGGMKDSVIRQLSAIDPAAASHILSEPCARNTAAAVALAAEYVARTFGEDAILWVLPADHHIADEAALTDAYAQALKAARAGKLVTFGINPTRPDTGYGYIRVGEAAGADPIHDVRQFVEKPDLATAQSYLASGDYLWNSGMFLFSARSVLEHFEKLAPAILSDVRAAMEQSVQTPDKTLYAAIEEQPFDKAIMEKSEQVAVVPCDPEWSDIGSWESLWDIRAKDENQNVIEGSAACHNAHGCLIQSKDRLIAVAGLDNIVVVDTEDAILITNKSDNDSMKALVKSLKVSGAPEVIDPPAARTPWSMVKTLSGKSELAAREITLQPGEGLTLPAQDGGMRLYTILSGTGSALVGGERTQLAALQSVRLQAADSGEIANTGNAPLVLIAVSEGAEEGIFFGTQTTPSSVLKIA